MRLALAVLVMCACADREPPTRRASEPANPDAALLVRSPYACQAVRTDAPAAGEQFPVPKPPFSPGVFPCTRCHDRPDDYNPTQRVLVSKHGDIRLVHGSREQWCYDCHNPSNRDMLRLAGGRLVSFEHSYELCGQCHGEKLRDWRVGIHGRRIGCWNGPREYLLCVSCHNPHAPHFKPLHPLPRPMQPGEIQLAAGREP
jgi:hypothetical protein